MNWNYILKTTQSSDSHIPVQLWWWGSHGYSDQWLKISEPWVDRRTTSAPVRSWSPRWYRWSATCWACSPNPSSLSFDPWRAAPVHRWLCPRRPAGRWGWRTWRERRGHGPASDQWRTCKIKLQLLSRTLLVQEISKVMTTAPVTDSETAEVLQRCRQLHVSRVGLLREEERFSRQVWKQLNTFSAKWKWSALTNRATATPASG